MSTINLGIVAHVDAGKTTLTEQILFETGIIRTMGRVDNGDAHTDRMDIERRRGISVKSASIKTFWRDTEINIIDTPGHVDFTAEIERALIALECAVLVISAVEGVQPQTELIYNALRNMEIPAVLFINKTDRTGADVRAVAADIRERLGTRVCDYSDKESILELLCENNDKLLQEYIEKGADGFERVALNRRLKEEFVRGGVTPYIQGSALNGVGVKPLLDMITDICPRFCDRSDGQLSGIIFKIEHIKTMGRIAHIKLYGGQLKNRDVIHNHSTDTDEKVVQIRRNQGIKVIDSGILTAGDIGFVSGLSGAKVGNIIGSPEFVKQPFKMTTPLLRVRLVPENENDYPALVEAVSELSAEDPFLNMTWVREKRELVINITGLIQIEILQEILLNRFDMNVLFEEPSVIYKETASVTAEGYDAYTMPKPCWAVLKFLIEPAERGSGISYDSTVKGGKILPAYQAHVKQALPEALRQGPLGWEITDVKITLIDGGYHHIHTHPLDFIVATPMAMMKGLVNAKTVLLEPMYRFKLSVPEEFGGKLLNEINLMRGSLGTTQTVKDKFYIEGAYPVSSGLYFPVRVASLTSGRGILSLDFGGYRECPLELGNTTPYIGVNPLDRAKYILHARKAL